MPWNGSGVFSRTNGVHTGTTLWVQDRDASTLILATRHDVHDQDLSDGINAALTRNNEAKPTATFLPNSGSAIDIGSSSVRWRAGYFDTLQPQDGSVGAPAYSFASNTNTGFYRSGANTIGVSGGGVNIGTMANAGWRIGSTGATNATFIDGSTSTQLVINRASGGVDEKQWRISSSSSSLSIDAVNDAFSGATPFMTVARTGIVIGACTWGNTQHLSAAGTGALPAYSFSGDPDTGILNDNANGLYVALGGSVFATFLTTGFSFGTGVTVSGTAGILASAGPIASRGTTGYLEITNSITAPAASAGFLRFYCDSADGFLKCKFGNGTVKTIATNP